MNKVFARGVSPAHVVPPDFGALRLLIPGVLIIHMPDAVGIEKSVGVVIPAAERRIGKSVAVSLAVIGIFRRKCGNATCGQYADKQR